MTKIRFSLCTSQYHWIKKGCGACFMNKWKSNEWFNLTKPNPALRLFSHFVKRFRLYHQILNLSLEYDIMIWQHPLKNAHKLLKSETWVCQTPYSNTGAVPCQCGFCHANGTTYIKRGPLMSLEMRNNFAWTANRCKPLWALLFSTHWEALLSWGRCPPANEERAP